MRFRWAVFAALFAVLTVDVLIGQTSAKNTAKPPEPTHVKPAPPIHQPKPAEPAASNTNRPQSVRRGQTAPGGPPAPQVPRVPMITWPAPIFLRQGQALTGGELNAIADAPGTFTYSPGAGYVPPKGNGVISVTFQPLDPRKYLSASGSVTFTVQ